MAEAGAGSLHGGDAAAAAGPGPGPAEEQELSRRLRRLYPAVNQEETPLPRSWSPKDKYNYIGLSQGNLRVHYKGAGAGPGAPRWARSAAPGQGRAGQGPPGPLSALPPPPSPTAGAGAGLQPPGGALCNAAQRPAAGPAPTQGPAGGSGGPRGWGPSGWCP